MIIVLGRIVAQAVGCRHPTAAAALVRSCVRSCVIYVGQSDSGADFLRVLRFPLPIFFTDRYVFINHPIIDAV
jgi:hypothetical protein